MGIVFCIFRVPTCTRR